MTLRAKKELIAALATAYAQAGRNEKTKLLDSFVSATGVNRKHAIQLLNADNSHPRQKRERQRTYGTDVHDALLVIWKASNYSCGKRLVPFMPFWIAALERHAHLSLTDEVRSSLLCISAATVDRMLKPERQNLKSRRVKIRRPGNSVREEIPIRTCGDWYDLKAGFVECDLVAHCGGDLSGQFEHTLTVTDIATSWTECVAIQSKLEEDVLQALRSIRDLLPFPLLSIDTDNGSEFINGLLAGYCYREEIGFTRGRPYKKNDQAHVEERNGNVVRRFLGYARYSGVEAHHLLNRIYNLVRLYVNFFAPSMKLIKKQRDGAKQKRTYERAQTPFQRVMRLDIDLSQKERLQRTFDSLDPIALLNEIDILRQKLHACTAADTVKKESPPKTKTAPNQRRVSNGWGAASLIRTLTPNVHRTLQEDPSRSPREIFEMLRAVVSSELNEKTHLRLLAVVVNEWRYAHPEFMKRYPRGFRARAIQKFGTEISDWRPGKSIEATRSQGKNFDEAKEVVRV